MSCESNAVASEEHRDSSGIESEETLPINDLFHFLLPHQPHQCLPFQVVVDFWSLIGQNSGDYFLIEALPLAQLQITGLYKCSRSCLQP